MNDKFPICGDTDKIRQYLERLPSVNYMSFYFAKYRQAALDDISSHWKDKDGKQAKEIPMLNGKDLATEADFVKNNGCRYWKVGSKNKAMLSNVESVSKFDYSCKVNSEPVWAMRYDCKTHEVEWLSGDRDILKHLMIELLTPKEYQVLSIKLFRGWTKMCGKCLK